MLTTAFHLVLYQPSIPPNTGNIARQCVGMRAMLHLVGPLAMDLGAQAVRRAGLDYWDALALQVHESPDVFLKWLGDREPWIVTKFGSMRYDRAGFQAGDVLILGNELTGLPQSWRDRWAHRAIHVPILGPVRSYNLANTAAIVMAQFCLATGMYDQGPQA